jgi:hypothetical protein
MWNNFYTAFCFNFNKYGLWSGKGNNTNKVIIAVYFKRSCKFKSFLTKVCEPVAEIFKYGWIHLQRFLVTCTVFWEPYDFGARFLLPYTNCSLIFKLRLFIHYYTLKRFIIYFAFLLYSHRSCNLFIIRGCLCLQVRTVVPVIGLYYTYMELWKVVPRRKNGVLIK